MKFRRSVKITVECIQTTGRFYLDSKKSGRVDTVILRHEDYNLLLKIL